MHRKIDTYVRAWTNARIGRLITAIFSALIVLASGVNPANAALISSIDYHSQVIATDPFAGRHSNSLIGTSLPVSATVTASSGATNISATYTFTDDGKTAILEIDTSLSMPPQANNGAGGSTVTETTGSSTPVNGVFPQAITLTFSQPVNYSASMSIKIVGQYDTAVLGAQLTNPLEPNAGFSDAQAHVGINPSFALSPFSGSLSGNGTYSLNESPHVTNFFPTGPLGAAATATSKFQITFTVVPEPGSLSLLMPGIVASLARRRRPRIAFFAPRR